ncbi:hypothetical protein IT411_02860, partial [Candidatus Peregrinibacteria bacterium]|nr:hypothetical protein [Candidatus Peregrinibacteria bacterium]
LVLANVAGKEEFAQEWLTTAQGKLSEAVLLDPSLSPVADQISILWPTP